MKHLILIRHGETLWTEQKRYQGHSDIKLSKEGRKNIRALSLRIKSLGIDCLYTSSLKRAMQSGAIISEAIGVKPRKDPRLNELNFGAWEGKTASQLSAERNKHFLSWSKGKWVTPKGGESLSSLQRRTAKFLGECLKKHANQKVAIVSHGGAIRMLINQALGLPQDFLFSFHMEPSSFSILNFSDFKSAQLIKLNVTPTSLLPLEGGGKKRG